MTIIQQMYLTAISALIKRLYILFRKGVPCYLVILLYKYKYIIYIYIYIYIYTQVHLRKLEGEKVHFFLVTYFKK